MDAGNTADTFGERLAVLRKRRGINQLDLAKKIGVTPKTISFWERGHATPQDMKNVAQLAEALQVRIDELIPEAYAAPKTEPIRPQESTTAPDLAPIQVLSKVPADYKRGYVEAKETILADVDFDRKTHYGLTVTGRSMWPTIFEGDYVIIRQHEMALSEYDEQEGPVKEEPWRRLHRHIVLASVNDGEWQLKRLFVYKSEDSGFRIMLQPDNRAADPIYIDRRTSLRICGVVAPNGIMRDPLNFE